MQGGFDPMHQVLVYLIMFFSLGQKQLLKSGL